MLQKSSEERNKKKGNRALAWGIGLSAMVFLLAGFGMMLSRKSGAVPDAVALEAKEASTTVVESPPKPAIVVDRSKQVGSDSNSAAEATSTSGRPKTVASEQKANAGEGKALVPGEPLLTQDFLDQLTAYAEWLLDIRLTEQQRRECQQLWVKSWKEANQPVKDRFWAYAKAELQEAKRVEQMSAAERDELRLQKQPLFVASLRKSSGQEDRMLLELFDSAHQPGGERNPILVAGAPPLTHDSVTRWTMFVEWILDVRLTEQQRQEFRRLFINDWKDLDHAAKDDSFKSNTQGLPSQLPLLNNYYRDMLRAQRQPRFLALLHKTSSHQLSQWLQEVHESAHKPGGERNQILVPGNLPLTQDMVSQYGAFIEWVLDLKVSGGLTALQLGDLREVLVNDWKTMDKSGKDSFLRLLKKWSAIIQLSDTERARNHEEMRAKFLAQLRSASDHEPSRWLLAIHNNEQELVKFYAKDLQIQMDNKESLIEGRMGNKPNNP